MLQIGLILLFRAPFTSLLLCGIDLLSRCGIFVDGCAIITKALLGRHSHLIFEWARTADSLWTCCLLRRSFSRRLSSLILLGHWFFKQMNPFLFHETVSGHVIKFLRHLMNTSKNYQVISIYLTTMTTSGSNSLLIALKLLPCARFEIKAPEIL